MDHSEPDLPRLLIFDLTLSGDGTATGELKETLLNNWPADRILHVHSDGKEQVGITGIVDGIQLVRQRVGYGRLCRLSRRFGPHCILYRPVPENLTLHHYAMAFIQTHPLPLVTWIMDDWPMRLQDTGKAMFRTMHEDLEWLLERSEVRLCISESMRAAYTDRYGCDFLPVANGIDPAEWPRRKERSYGPFTIRYAGSLAENMSLESVLTVARAVERIANSGIDVRLQINTRSQWADLYGHLFRPFSSCRVSTTAFNRQDYRAFLQNADLLLIAYNFDEASLNYVRYSLANKLPECLISGTPLLVYGPAEVATVGCMLNSLPDAVVSTSEQQALETWIRDLIESPDRQALLSGHGRELALDKFQLSEQKERLTDAVRAAADTPFRHELWRSFRHEHLKLNEQKLATLLRGTVSGSSGVPSETDQNGGGILTLKVNQIDLSDPNGVPSTPFRPGIILVEQIRTAQQESDWRKIADHLATRGYSVLISEWRPADVSRAELEWRSIRMYPCEPIDDPPLVTLIAVAGEPDTGTLMDAIEQSVVRPPLAGVRTAAIEFTRRTISIGRSVFRRMRSRLIRPN